MVIGIMDILQMVVMGIKRFVTGDICWDGQG